jgi:hypothetical protein
MHGIITACFGQCTCYWNNEIELPEKERESERARERESERDSERERERERKRDRDTMHEILTACRSNDGCHGGVALTPVSSTIGPTSAWIPCIKSSHPATGAETRVIDDRSNK